jgi:hypothetical protein
MQSTPIDGLPGFRRRLIVTPASGQDCAELEDNYTFQPQGMNQIKRVRVMRDFRDGTAQPLERQLFAALYPQPTNESILDASSRIDARRRPLCK